MVSAFGFLKRLWNGPASAFKVQSPQAEAVTPAGSPAQLNTSPDRPKSLQDFRRAPSTTGYVDVAALGHFSQPTPSRPTSVCKDTSASQTTFHPPPSLLNISRSAHAFHLGSASYQPLNNINPAHTPLPSASYQPLNNINPAHTPPPSASSANDNINTSSASANIKDVEMSDAPFIHNSTPPATPPTHEEKISPGENIANKSGQHNATVEVTEETEDEEPGGTFIPAPKIAEKRPKITPKSLKDHLREQPGLYVRPDHASEFVVEEFKDSEDPMPKGYWETWRGYRMGYSTVEDYCVCGVGGGHFLVCGHQVISKEPCGTNCKIAHHEYAGFKCEQCIETVSGIFENKLTQEEKDNIALFQHNRTEAAYVGLCVEAVMKHMPLAKGNITESVMSIVMKDYGRESLAYKTVDDPNEPKTLADAFRYHHERGQAKTREIIAEHDLGSLNTLGKGKAVDEITQPPGVASPATNGTKKQKTTMKSRPEPITTDTRGTKRDTIDDPLEPSVSDTIFSNKKPKAKLESHREPVSSRTRGTKRDAKEDVPEPSVSDTTTSNKKAKAKLESHRASITTSTRGTKHNNTFSFNPSPTKRATKSFPRESGDAAFKPVPPGVLPPMLRKRAAYDTSDGYDDWVIEMAQYRAKRNRDAGYSVQGIAPWRSASRKMTVQLPMEAYSDCSEESDY
ncbi:hypothetical protein CC86DRAFT_454645 [Ophiobolus disseminans]|uniref:Uncharacterized protein n=1 Tax=Ophiobolus disseminans TaxID=1469910 RepID=A0A6A7A3K5_9PLEO|nr:hypothetical protein CC86DRAFT_454645 [Ophiobolus disseminans]